MSAAKVSVITVVRNAASTIEATLRSVAEQTYPAIEHLVIDGASTDGTLEILRRHQDRLALRSAPDRGMFDAMNKGLAAASGEVVGFLHADDAYADPAVLADMMRSLETAGADACYGDLVYVARNDERRVVRYWKSQPYREGLFERGWMPAHPTFYVRRRVYQAHGGFDLAYPRQSDFELALRLLAVKRVPSVYIPRVLVRMRSGGASSGLGHILAGNLEAYRACRAHGLDVSPLFMATKIASRLPQFLPMFRR